MMKDYKFAGFNGKDDIVEKIKSIEKEISQSVGHEIILLAYEKGDM